MQRQTRMEYGSVTTYDRAGNVVSHWESTKEVLVPIRREPAVFEAFKAAIESHENIIAIAQRFETDHCTVLYWKHRFLRAAGGR